MKTTTKQIKIQNQTNKRNRASGSLKGVHLRRALSENNP